MKLKGLFSVLSMAEIYASWLMGKRELEKPTLCMVLCISLALEGI